MKKITARSRQQSISLPLDVKSWLKKRAKSNHRSMNGEAVLIICMEKEREARKNI